jgi:hypothetical protein
VILIARRHRGQPDVVGFGIVSSDVKTRGIEAPDKSWDGSYRKLSPFVPWSGNLPDGIMSALSQTAALRRLDPTKAEHRRICAWMLSRLSRASLRSLHGNRKSHPAPKASYVKLGDLPHDHEFEFEVRRPEAVKRAKKLEAKLVNDYERWLAKKQRHLGCLCFGQIRCDVYEAKRRNLLEAKCRAKREHIRMAVGQLLDYAHLARRGYQNLNLAILLPEKPLDELTDWLSLLRISVAWRENRRFADNANGQFC